MPEREEAGQPQGYCSYCGAQARQGNVFCVSCGERLGPAAATQDETITTPTVRGASPRYGGLLNQGNRKVALYGVGVILLLIVAYLLLSYSVGLGVLLIGLVGFAVLVVRRTRGNQTRLEQQAFERAGQYRESAQRAYEEGKHREVAQSAYQHSKQAYEGVNAQYRRWSENQAPGAERGRRRPTGILGRIRNAWAWMPTRWRWLFVGVVLFVPVVSIVGITTVYASLASEEPKQKAPSTKAEVKASQQAEVEPSQNKQRDKPPSSTSASSAEDKPSVATSKEDPNRGTKPKKETDREAEEVPYLLKYWNSKAQEDYVRAMEHHIKTVGEENVGPGKPVSGVERANCQLSKAMLDQPNHEARLRLHRTLMAAVEEDDKDGDIDYDVGDRLERMGYTCG